MADSPPPPSPPPPLPPPDPTTISALGDDILREIFLRLPAFTTLARAAFSCRTFLHAVRSSPAFRRHFRELREPPLLALFLAPYMRAIVPAAADKSSDIAAAFSGLLRDSDDSESEWRSEPVMPYYEGYASFVSRATDQFVSYSPHSRALNIFPKNYGEDNDACLEFYTLSPDGEERRPSRVVCVHRDRAWAWACVAVFSSRTMEWQVVLPEMGTLVVGSYGPSTPKVFNGFVCWFFQMDLPLPLKGPFSTFELGHTKDGKFCVISVLQCMISVWLWATDSDGVERFMLHKTISLHANVSEITGSSEEADVSIQLMAVIDGFVYLSLIIGDPHSPQWFLSFCLETAEVNLLHKEGQCTWRSVDLYIMVSWPASLIHGKEDSEAGVTGHISEDDGPMGTEEALPVLYTALRSFREQLIDDGNSNFTEIDSFLLDDERNSLLNRIATLESGLAASTDRALRISTEPKA